ncbi:MAG: cobyrinate a,c-diamide synthase [Chloroflexota bacterium]
MSIPRILIAGQSSGVGKTTITLGIIAALSRRGLRVQPFKCGPDYIDPTYHTLASGRPCRNLDTWMLTPEQMVADFNRASVGADIAVIEGVMGLFDGSSYTEETGSSAHIAKLMSAPVLLVLDIGKLARSAGALALGYQQFDPELNLAGVILNRAGSESHANGCAEAIDAMTQLPSVGWLSKHSGLHIPERHLGLIPTDERSSLETLVDASADAVEATFDLNRIVQVAGWKGGRVEGWKGRRVEREIIPKHVTLAVARDESFSVYYTADYELIAEIGD